MDVSLHIAELLKATIVKLPQPEPVLPYGQQAHISDNDTDQELAVDDLSDEKSSAFFIVYKNTSEIVSKRRISVRKVKHTLDGSCLIQAYCFERKSLRSFKAVGIIEAIDLATGEIYTSPQEFLQALGESEKPTDTPAIKSTRAAVSKCHYALNILVYIARCDGHFHFEEENTVIHYLMNECFDTDFHEEYLQSSLRGRYPDLQAFLKAVDYYQTHRPDNLPKIGRYAARLVQADGNITKEELGFCTELQNYLSR